MSYAKMAETLKSGLKLSHEPIGISFLQDPPEGIPHLSSVVPSACSLWRVAEKTVFYASAEDHFNCPIGTLTMGFQLPPGKKEEADQLFKEMLSLQYLSEDEFPKIPSVTKPHQVVLYGPLSSFSNTPDAVLLITLPGQAMVLSEAGGTATWTGPALSLLGRPTCGAIPQAMDHGSAMTSTACIGARTYAEIGDDELVFVIPQSRLEETVGRFSVTLTANQTLSAYFKERKREISSNPGKKALEVWS